MLMALLVVALLAPLALLALMLAMERVEQPLREDVGEQLTTLLELPGRSQ